MDVSSRIFHCFICQAQFVFPKAKTEDDVFKAQTAHHLRHHGAPVETYTDEETNAGKNAEHR